MAEESATDETDLDALATHLQRRETGLMNVTMIVSDAGTAQVTGIPRSNDLDLSGCDDFTTNLDLTITAGNRATGPYSITGINLNLLLRIERSGSTTFQRLEGTGTVSITSKAGPVDLQQLDGLTALEVIETASPISVGSASCDVVVNGGTLIASGPPDRIRFKTGKLTAARNATIPELIVEGPLKVTLDNKGFSKVTKLIGFGPEASLEVEPDAGGTSSLSTPRFTVSEIRDIKVRLSSAKTTVVVQREAIALTLAGKGLVEFGKGAAGDDLTFEGAGLLCGAGATLTNVKGRLHLSACTGASVGGHGDDGYLILDERDHHAGGNRVPADWSGSILTGFRLPHGLAGRRLVGKMADCYHLNPSTTGMPGWSTVFSRRWWPELVKAKDIAVGLDAEFVRELARVSKEKGAPGPTRTKLGWCSNRLRHRGSSGVEWWGLAGYRLLGYGERPLPPLATWLLLSLALTFMALATTTNGFGDTFGAISLGPLAGLMRIRGPETGDLTTTPWLIVRALLALPLVTGLLALRNYVKGE